MEIPPEYQHQVTEEDIPGWVMCHPVESPTAADTTCPALLRDAQHNLETGTIFHRVVYYLPNHASVQHGSRIEIDFAPEAERVVVHTLQIYRNGEVIDLRPRQSVRVLNRETQMERFVFDGRLQAILLLHDVRTGDVIDYSFSRQAIKEPLFGRVSGRFLLEGSFSAKAVRCRLLCRPPRVVCAVPHNCNAQPAVSSTEDGLSDYRWEMNNVKPLLTEPDMPLWSVPYRWVDYGEFSTWEEVAEAASRLFAPSPEPLPGYIATWLEQVRAGAESPEQFILQVIRYVQEHIRYVSVSIDEHTHRPYDIPTIIERNYGDCKDKATLLCRFLREAGFEAVPALVHAHLGDHVASGLPRPTAFNHVIVRLKYGGQFHWIDATLTDQGGRLGNIACPAYGSALVLNSPRENLVTIPVTPSASTISYDEFVKVHQTDGSAELRVTRTYTGRSADQIRHQLTAAGLDALDHATVTDYQAAYPDVTIQKPATLDEKRDENQITIVQTLLLRGIWRQVQSAPQLGNQINQACFPVFGVQPLLRLPPPGKRQYPFIHPYPYHLKASLEVRLPSGFKPFRNQGTLKSAAFECKHFSETSSNSGRVNLQYVSLGDSVPPANMAGHAEAIQRLAQLARFFVQAPASRIGRGFDPRYR